MNLVGYACYKEAVLSLTWLITAMSRPCHVSIISARFGISAALFGPHLALLWPVETQLKKSPTRGLSVT